MTNSCANAVPNQRKQSPIGPIRTTENKEIIKSFSFSEEGGGGGRLH